MTREFVYMPTFEKQWSELKLSDEHQRELEVFLCEHPESGDMIQGSGGLRKLRWALPGKGKSGSVRTLYVDFAYFEQIYMIACFKKNVQENITQAEKKQIKSVIEQIKENLRMHGENDGT
ncbi:MAG: type II toxin-antitoxin system RelE/ParE family toxin [Spirochaetales bacterium]|nr:type II toxin-antitoxin system RelE/ParE family toxin [Spirochaetales bacterium]